MDSSNDLKKCFAFCTKPALAFFKAFLAFDGSNFFLNPGLEFFSGQNFLISEFLFSFIPLGTCISFSSLSTSAM